MTWTSVPRRAAAQAVKVTAAAVDVVRRQPRGIVVLVFHRVGASSGSAVDQPIRLFDQQMSEIADRATTLDTALDALTGEAATNERDIVVTFDDGTADFVDHALPILVRHGVPAALYVATGFIENQREFPGGAPPLSWSALRDAVSTGLVTVGSHTDSHALLDRVDRDTAAAELDRSIDLIGERLELPVTHFAYPKGQPPNEVAEAEVRRRFRSAALGGTIANAYGRTDPYRLSRSPIQVADGMQWFRRKAAGGMFVEDRLRRVANRRRYAQSVT